CPKSLPRLRLTFSTSEERLGAVGFNGGGQTAKGMDIGSRATRDVAVLHDLPDSSAFAFHGLLEAGMDFLDVPVEALTVLYPFEIGNSHAASIGQNVGQDDGALFVEDLVGIRGDRAVCEFEDNLGLDRTGIFL